jgi:hypothetical protein
LRRHYKGGPGKAQGKWNVLANHIALQDFVKRISGASRVEGARELDSLTVKVRTGNGHERTLQTGLG